MKIAHSSFDPRSGLYLIALVGVIPDSVLERGVALRCAGYRFSVSELVADHRTEPSPSVVLRVASEDAPTVGMVVHPADEPLTDEELAAALQHLLMIPRMLKAVDMRGVTNRMLHVPVTLTEEVRLAAVLFHSLALQLDRLQLPSDEMVQNAERYKAELLRAC